MLKNKSDKEKDYSLNIYTTEEHVTLAANDTSTITKHMLATGISIVGVVGAENSMGLYMKCIIFLNRNTSEDSTQVAVYRGSCLIRYLVSQ